MLTQKSYKFLGQHFFLGSLTCIIPFTWDPKTRRLSAFKSKFRLLVVYLHFILSTIVSSWYWRCIINGVNGGHRPVSNLVVDILFALTYTSQYFWQIGNILMTEEFASLISQIINFDRMYTQKYCKAAVPMPTPPSSGNGAPSATTASTSAKKTKNVLTDLKKEKPEKEETDGCDANICMSFYMMFVYAALNASLFLRNPYNDRYLYSPTMDLLGVDADTAKKYHLVKVWAVLEYYHLVKYCFVFNNIFYIILLYAHSTNFWLKYLSHDQDKKCNENSRPGWVQVHRVNEAVQNYKAAQVLNIQFNVCCSRIVIPIFKVLNVALHVVATFVTITFHEEIPIGGFLIFPIGFVMWCGIETDVYPLLGRIDELSTNYLESWKPLGAKHYSRQFKAMRPLGVKVASCYSINKSTVLGVWSAIFNLVVNCIVF